MNKSVRFVIREIVKELGIFDGLKLHKKAVFGKRLSKMILKCDSNDSKIKILNALIKDENLINLNKKEQSDKIFKKMYFRIPRAMYKQYRVEIYDYIFEYVDLYLELDIDNFIIDFKKQKGVKY